jgi:polysaccharide export outer membrane protein
LNLRVVAIAAVAMLAGVIGHAPAAPISTAVSEPSVTVSSTYRLMPYDVIDVSVYGEDELHTRCRLGADGSAVLPLIGTVNLDGKTVADANDLIQKKYADGFVKDPHVLLSVVEYRKSTFAIMGEVGRPGIYEIPEGTHMTIVDAVLMAGGFSHSADRNGVRVKRLVHGKETVYKVKAGAMADSPDLIPFEVLPGDVVSVRESWW